LPGWNGVGLRAPAPADQYREEHARTREAERSGRALDGQGEGDIGYHHADHEREQPEVVRSALRAVARQTDRQMGGGHRRQPEPAERLVVALVEGKPACHREGDRIEPEQEGRRGPQRLSRDAQLVAHCRGSADRPEPREHGEHGWHRGAAEEEGSSSSPRRLLTGGWQDPSELSTEGQQVG